MRSSETAVDDHISIVSNATVAAGRETLPPTRVGAAEQLPLGKLIEYTLFRSYMTYIQKNPM